MRSGDLDFPSLLAVMSFRTNSTSIGYQEIFPSLLAVMSFRTGYRPWVVILYFPSLLAVMSFWTRNTSLSLFGKLSVAASSDVLSDKMKAMQQVIDNFPSLLAVMSFRTPPSLFVRDLAPDIRNLGANGPIRPDSRRGPE